MADQKSIHEHYQETITWVEGKIGWYEKNIKWKRGFSIAIRWLSIVIVIVAGLMPFLDASIFKTHNDLNGLNLSTLGYILLYIAAGINIWDRLAGYSSGWLRYTNTQMEMGITYVNFLDEWYFRTYGLDLDKFIDKKIVLDLKIILDNFKNNIMALEKSETEAWITEFKNTQQELGQLIKSRTAEIKKNVDAQRKEQDEATAKEKRKLLSRRLKLEFKNTSDYEQLTLIIFQDEEEVMNQNLDQGIKSKIIQNLEPKYYVVKIVGTKSDRTNFSSEYEANLIDQDSISIDLDMSTP